MRNLIDEKKLVPFLEDSYGFRIKKIYNGPRGFVAETFIVETDSGKFFVKVSKKGGYARYIIQSLPILDELIKFGLKQTAKLIKSQLGGLFCEFENHVVVLFDFVEGEWSFDCDFQKTVEILARLHKLTPKVKSKAEKEDFRLPLEEEYLRHFKMLQSVKSSDIYLKELSAIIIKRKDRLDSLWKRFKRRAEECRNFDFNLVLTHGDALCNLIKDKKGEVFLVDWDDILLAPAERDNWFLLGNDKRKRFLKIYKQFFPIYKPNQTAYEFYVLRRYFDDIEGFIKEIFEQKNDQARQQNLKELYEIFEWLDPEIKEFA